MGCALSDMKGADPVEVKRRRSSAAALPRRASAQDPLGLLPMDAAGALDEQRCKTAFIAARSKEKKRSSVRRQSNAHALFTTRGLAAALDELGFAYDGQVLAEAFEEFDLTATSLLEKDFITLCRKLLDEPDYLQPTSARRMYAEHYAAAFETAAKYAKGSSLKGQVELADALAKLGLEFPASEFKLNRMCQWIDAVKQMGEEDDDMISFDLFVTACVKFKATPEHGRAVVGIPSTMEIGGQPSLECGRIPLSQGPRY